MATYKEIKGTQIQAVATDPSDPVEGQVWYNTTSQVLKGSKGALIGSWSTVNPINNQRYYLAGSGTQTAALGYGGRPPSGTPSGGNFSAQTESWNGTNWTEVNDLNTSRQALSGAGT